MAEGQSYQEYLASMGLVKGSPEEIALLQKVFGVAFEFEEEEDPEDQGEHHHGPDCGCGDHCGCGCGCGHQDQQELWDEPEPEEMSDQEVMEAVKAYLAAHPEDRPGR